MENVRWYNKCLKSLLCETKDDGWFYLMIKERSAQTNKTAVDDLIKDTKLRFRALIQYTSELIIKDRMGRNSYQYPTSIYQVVKRMFVDSTAVIASEALMTIGNWDYRVRSNLLMFILLEEVKTEVFIQNMTLFFMALEETKNMEETYQLNVRDMTFSEFYPSLISEMKLYEEEYIKPVITQIRTSAINYRLLYDDILWKANACRIEQSLVELYARSKSGKSNYMTEGMQTEIIRFFDIDTGDYLEKGEASSYSPFWIFGAKHYQENLQFILDRKKMIEFDTSWIIYLQLKAEANGETPVYISSFKAMNR